MFIDKNVSNEVILYVSADTDTISLLCYCLLLLFLFLELHLTTSELWFGQEQEGILP